MRGGVREPATDRLRVALVHPTYWPEVRRGSERFVHDLAAYLSGRGHEVTVVTGHRGPPSRSREDGFTVLRGWRPPARLRPRGLEPYAEHAPGAAAALAARRFDLVHALHLPDAWAATWAARLRRRPLIVSLMGYPDAHSLDAFRGRRRMLARAAGRAAAVHVLSDAAMAALRDAAGIEARVINPGTDTAAFRSDAPRAAEPTVFCAASPADPRKRVPLLVEAFRLLREREPRARLVLDAGGAPPDPMLRSAGIEVVDERGGLAARYAGAWVTVLPSEREAFGLVLVESLAAGTPAVGIDDGGVAEILDDPEVGVLCPTADPPALADAIGRGLDLGRREGAREACRAHAQRWDWRNVGPRFEGLYREAAGPGR